MKYLVIICLIFYTLNSQELDKPLYWIGANGGLNINYNSADFDGLPGYDCCSKGFGSQMGFSYYLGLLFKYEIQDNLKLDFRLNYKPYAGDFKEEQKIGNTQVLVPNNQVLIVDAISDISITPTINMFSLDLGAEYLLDNNISILGGLSPSYILQGKFSQQELLKSPSNVVFADNQSKVRNSFVDKDIENLNSLQFQVYVGAAYKYLLKKDNYLNFELKYYQAFTNVSSVDWKINNIFAGVSYEYPIYPSKEKQIFIDTIYQRDTSDVIVYNKNEEKLSLVDRNVDVNEYEDENTIHKTFNINEKYENYKFQKSDISAEMKVYGISSDGRIQDKPTITIEETETEQGFPVLPYIFFDVDKGSLKNTLQKILTKEETARFDENKLNWDVFDVYNNTLNIVAKRIKDNNLTIELVGNRIIADSTFEDKGLIENRVKEIKDYFTNVWGINPSKINSKISDVKITNLKKSDDLYKEASRVEINSNAVDVVLPVFLKENIKKSDPPKIGIDVTINSKNTPVSWDLGINQNSTNLRKFDGDELNFTKVWDVMEDPHSVLEDKILFNLEAKDKYGSEVKLENSLKLNQLTIKKKREILNNDKKIEKYSLIVFDYNSAELKEAHKEIINKVKSSIKPNSTVTIAGYADRTGELQYNQQLAQKRIQSVKQLLNVPADYKLIPYGSSVLLYDNDTEVGRSLSRTVQITIETPIK